MRTFALAVTCAVALAAAPAAPADKPAVKDAPKDPQAKLMAEKLKQAQKLLDGLATNDFDKIVKSAEELMLISKTAEFLAVKTREYELHTNDFRRSLQTVIKKGKEKNLDGAALGYVDLTLTCVRCHEHTREVRNARLPAVGPDLLAGLGR